MSEDSDHKEELSEEEKEKEYHRIFDGCGGNQSANLMPFLMMAVFIIAGVRGALFLLGVNLHILLIANRASFLIVLICAFWLLGAIVIAAIRTKYFPSYRIHFDELKR